MRSVHGADREYARAQCVDSPGSLGCARTSCVDSASAVLGGISGGGVDSRGVHSARIVSALEPIAAAAIATDAQSTDVQRGWLDWTFMGYLTSDNPTRRKFATSSLRSARCARIVGSWHDRHVVEVRRPVQARAIRRREQILDAAARLLAREGFRGLNTNAVAREAETAVGTLYEYFRDKEALVEGLLLRYEDRLRSAIHQALEQAGPDPLAAADGVVDAFAHVWRDEPGYRAVWTASQSESLLSRTSERWATSFTSDLTSVIRGYFPKMPKATASLTARAAVHLVSGLLLAAMTGPTRFERAMVIETKLALRSYLTARAAPFMT